MKGALGFVDERGVLGPKELLSAIRPHGNKPRYSGSEQGVKLRSELIGITERVKVKEQTGDFDADSSRRSC